MGGSDYEGYSREYLRGCLEMIENTTGLGLNEDDRDTIEKIVLALAGVRPEGAA